MDRRTEGFLEDLAQVKDKAKITVRINSVGGDLYTALGICNRLKELNGDTVAVIDGIAASAATIIAMGCKTREIAEGALFMVHEALLTLVGNYNRSWRRKHGTPAAKLSKMVFALRSARAARQACA